MARSSSASIKGESRTPLHIKNQFTAFTKDEYRLELQGIVTMIAAAEKEYPRPGELPYCELWSTIYSIGCTKNILLDALQRSLHASDHSASECCRQPGAANC